MGSWWGRLPGGQLLWANLITNQSLFHHTDTKERPFKCTKCKSTFVRRDLLLRHDRTVHAKDGGVPLVSEVKRRSHAKGSSNAAPAKPSMELDTATLEQIEASIDGMIDLEAAAMLMTDIHHKATAAMLGRDDDLDDNTSPYSPDHTTMFDDSVPYMGGAVPVAQMTPWDPFMSQTVNEPKAHSISSSVSGSQGSQVSQLSSFNSTTTLQPQTSQLPAMERYPSNNDALNPTLQSFHNSMPLSGPGTPSGLSPFPLVTGPISPVDYRRSPGPSQPLTAPKVPQTKTDEELNMILENLKKSYSDSAIGYSLQDPTRDEMDKYLSAYFSLFHHHLPFLHPETFNLVQVSPPLLLSVLSIGALYSLEEESAFKLHVGSKMLVNQYLQRDDFDSRKTPLWTMQSMLLNTMFASWSGNAKGLEWACSIKGLLSNVCASWHPVVSQ